MACGGILLTGDVIHLTFHSAVLEPTVVVVPIHCFIGLCKLVCDGTEDGICALHARENVADTPVEEVWQHIVPPVLTESGGAVDHYVPLVTPRIIVLEHLGVVVAVLGGFVYTHKAGAHNGRHSVDCLVAARALGSLTDVSKGGVKAESVVRGVLSGLVQPDKGKVFSGSVPVKDVCVIIQGLLPPVKHLVSGRHIGHKVYAGDAHLLTRAGRYKRRQCLLPGDFPGFVGVFLIRFLARVVVLSGVFRRVLLLVLFLNRRGCAGHQRTHRCEQTEYESDILFHNRNKYNEKIWKPAEGSAAAGLR